MEFYVSCDEVGLFWLVYYNTCTLPFPVPPVSPHQGTAHVLFFRCSSPGKKRSQYQREKEWEVIVGKLNDVNYSVHKFCKALIIQDAASYPNYTNNIFLTLLLRKTFYTAHGLL